MAALLPLAAVACGGGRDPDPRPSVTTETRVVEGANGSISVPVGPTRIVVLGTDVAAAVGDLGVAPVGAPAAAIEEGGALFAATRDIGVRGAYDRARIEELQPDLVIGTAHEVESLGEITDVAVVALPEMGGLDDWRERPRFIAAVLGMEKRLGEVEAEFAERLELARGRARGREEGWLLLGVEPVAGGRVDPGVVFLYGVESPLGALLYREVGVRPPAVLAGQVGGETLVTTLRRAKAIDGVRVAVVNVRAGGAGGASAAADDARTDAADPGSARAFEARAAAGADLRVVRAERERGLPVTGYGRASRALNMLGL